MYEEGSNDDLGPRGTFETYRAEGDALFKNGEYRKAIESYTTALEIKATEKNCLVARSRCHLQLGETEKALIDAEASLQEDKDFHKGLFQKADALYCKGEFELALMFYHRGHKMRPELQEFRLGIQKAQEAIDNCVGSPDKVHLTKDGDLSFFLKQDEKKKGKGQAGTYQRPPTRQHTMNRGGKEGPKSALNDKTVKQLLGELYGDRMYLEKLLKETDPSTQSGRTIYDLVQQGLQYLDTRTEFWRQQKPMYARKRDRQMQQAKFSNKKKGDPSQYIIKELERIDEEYTAGKYSDSLKRAKKCLKMVQDYNEDDVHNRGDVVANLHSCHGNAYLEMGDYEKALYHHQTDLEIAEQQKLEDAKSRALDNLGRVHARSGAFQKAIDAWSTKIPISKTPLERTWLFHEVGRCHLELENFKEARDFGEKSVTAAREAKDDNWQLNATVLVAQAEVKLGEHESAVESFQQALDMAKIQGDQAAEGAIKKAIEDVNNKIVQGLKSEKGAKDETQAEEKAEETPKGKSPPPKAASPPPKAESPPPKAASPPPKAASPPPKAESPPPQVEEQQRESSPPPAQEEVKEEIPETEVQGEQKDATEDKE